MKYFPLLLGLCFFSLSLSSHAQDTLYLDANKRVIPFSAEVEYYAFFGKEGKEWMFRSYFLSNNQLQSEGAFTNKKREKYKGEWNYYYENGNKKRTFSDFEDGYASGPYTAYYENGEVQFKGFYKNGVYSGDWIEWYKDGTKRGEFSYPNKATWPLIHNLWLPDGSQTIKDGNGEYVKFRLGDENPMFVGNVQDKLRVGEWRSYYESGELLEKVEFEKGVAEGELNYYHENGEIEFSGELKRAEFIGMWKLFDEKGNILQEIDIKDAYGNRGNPPYMFGQRSAFALNINEIRKQIGYPKLAQDAGIQGQVLLRVLFDEEGEYLRHEVLSEVHPILTEATLKHIHKLRYTKAIQDAKAIQFWAYVPFNFKLIN
ncbi:MAG: energy transducer TonB [Bacteroidia bacterium]|nr:energy transducer TonB [Bacteroidia bacterium]